MTFPYRCLLDWAFAKLKLPFYLCLRIVSREIFDRLHTLMGVLVEFYDKIIYKSSVLMKISDSLEKLRLHRDQKTVNQRRL